MPRLVIYIGLSLPFLPSQEFEENSEDRELQGYNDTEQLSLNASGSKNYLKNTQPHLKRRAYTLDKLCQQSSYSATLNVWCIVSTQYIFSYLLLLVFKLLYQCEHMFNKKHEIQASQCC